MAGSNICLSIVIVSWNTRDLLLSCLNSIFENPPNADFDVWVVDNASADTSVAAVRQSFPQVRIVESPTNLGFAGANNLGLRQSRGELILLLNSDARVKPGTLQAMVDFMAANPAASLLGPKLVNPDGSFQGSYANFPSLLSELLLAAGLARFFIGPYAPSPRPYTGEQARPVDWVAGAAMLVRRTVFERVGGMDEDYFLYSEETDWCWAIKRAGGQVWYHPDIEVIHRWGASTGQRSTAAYARLYQSKIRFFDKNYGRLAGWAVKWLLAVVLSARLCAWYVLRVVKGGRAADPYAARIERELAFLKNLGPGRAAPV